MQKEMFLVNNFKCGGCATTIREGLSGISGVEDMVVVIQEGGVTVSGETLNWTVLAQKLDELGDPEAA